MERKKLVKMGVFTIVSILLVWLLFQYVNISQIQKVFMSVSLKGILIGFLFYVASYVIRAARFYWLLDKKIKVGMFFFIVCLHNMINSLIPARIGELSYVYFVKKRGVPVTQAAASLVAARIFDLVSVVLLFFIALMISWNSLPVFFTNLTPYVIGLLVAISVGLLLIMLFAKKFLVWFRALCKNKFIANLVDKITDFTEHFCKNHSKRKLLMLFVTSIFLWICQFLVIYSIFADILQISFWYIIMGALAVIFSTVMPVQGIAGFGSIEGAWALAFIALGVSKELAIASGFVYHFVFIGYFVTLGIVGTIGWKVYTKSQ